IEKDYIAVEDKVDFIGERSFEAGILSIGSTTYEGQKLTLSELYEFFKIEQSAIFRLLVLYVVLLLLASVFQYYQTYLLQKSSNQIVKQMREDVFSHTQKIPINYFVDQPAGKIVARITNDTEAIRE